MLLHYTTSKYSPEYETPYFKNKLQWAERRLFYMGNYGKWKCAKISHKIKNCLSFLGGLSIFI